MEFQDETSDAPKPLEVADLSERRRKNQDAPFFEIKRHQYPDCTHKWKGVTLDVETRRVFCKCGEQIDAFDALLIYAHAERRLISTREAIAEHDRKEAEQKAKRPFVKRTRNFSARYDTKHRIVGYNVNLECGHGTVWMRRGKRKRSPPRTMTCQQCYRESKLKDQGANRLG